MPDDSRSFLEAFSFSSWFAALCAVAARAQGNYEIQVYGADTVAPRNTMVELHSNFTADGQRNSSTAWQPTNHAEHETIEITQGINDWSEVGFYIFTSEPSGQGVQWVGDHIRPRVRVPEKWRWPVGVSLSTEVGYQRARYSPDTWNWEIRPIIDKTIGPLVLGRESGPGARLARARCEARHRLFAGSENQLRLYEADHRRPRILRRLRQHHEHRQPCTISSSRFFPAIDLNVSPELGDQLRRRRRPHRGHRPLDREMHCRAAGSTGAGNKKGNEAVIVSHPFRKRMRKGWDTRQFSYE